jgi:N-succinyldiaminopimelate aminotransferase
VAAARGIKQFLTYVSGGPFQHAVAAGLALPDSYFSGLRNGLAAKRDRLCAGLASVGLEVYRPRGTYFVLTDVRPLGYDDGMAFCLDLPRRAGVVAIPAGVFYDDQSVGRPLVRWAYCKRDEVLDDAVARLGAAFA